MQFVESRSSFLVVDSKSVLSCILLLLMNFEHKYYLFATVFHTPHASNAQQNIVVEGSGSFMIFDDASCNSLVASDA